MNAVVNSYDDVAMLVDKDFVKKMGGVDWWNANPLTFKEMQSRGVEIKDLINIFLQSPKIPSKTKKLFALKCAERVVCFLSSKIKDRSIILKALKAVKEKTQKQREKSINEFQHFCQKLNLNCRVIQDIQDSFALAVVTIVTNRGEITPSGVYGCSLYARYAALYCGGAEFITKESQNQLNDIIKLTETSIE